MHDYHKPYPQPNTKPATTMHSTYVGIHLYTITHSPLNFYHSLHFQIAIIKPFWLGDTAKLNHKCLVNSIIETYINYFQPVREEEVVGR